MVAVLLLGARVFLDHPVRNLHMEGSFQRVTPVEVQAAMAPGLQGSFLSVDLVELRGLVETLAWVKRVQVARQWPDTLVIRVTEHQVAARWGDTSLISREGEVFAGEARYMFPELPRLGGPPNTERRVVDRYLELQRLLGAANLTLSALSIDERGSWRMQLQGGQTIRIGRSDVEQRLDRFFHLAAPLLRNEFDRVSHVDMRYTNGFSVGWRPVASGVSTAAAGGE
ncbi:MAG: cell division protein FtsQ/DivIB [Rhodospirillaceae bacterium]|nr:cell division protein FtsQ/DivIB [Rhodospirillaceae bacterium]